MKNSLLIICVSLFQFTVLAQVLTDSNLPIVIIQTDLNQEISDETKIGAVMKIIYRPDGSRNYMTDQTNPAFLNYTGRMKIEVRGSTSQSLEKKPYGLTTYQPDDITENNVTILNMPQEHDWVLNSLAFDPSCIRDYLSYQLGLNTGNYAARSVFCEVIVNGDYKGLYVFMEKLKADEKRINILKILPTDNQNEALTGGYITKADKNTGGDDIAWSMDSYNNPSDFIHHYPKPENITAPQNDYISSYFNQFQNQLTLDNNSITTGYPSLIDIPTFVDFMLLNELASNADGYQFSTYFHKDRNGKLRAGPIWDFNLSFGNDLFLWGYDRSHTDVWQFDNGDNTGAKFWKDLYDAPSFNCYLSKRWQELIQSGKPFNYSVISQQIDATVTLISEAIIRENQRWGTIGDHSATIVSLKSWLQTRINWMTNQLNDVSACNNVTVPELVISRIHYNPIAVNPYTSEELEFIQITNHSNSTVNLSGIYFKHLGLTYQFPANSTVAANQVIYLAGNSAAFAATYGFTPFGVFTRNMSDKSHDLVLADAFGNTIDQVHYHDNLPWPTEPDGGGYFLQLANLDYDNSLASSWIPSNSLLKTEEFADNIGIKLFPNPTTDHLYIESNGAPISSIEVFNLVGELVTDIAVTTNQSLVDVDLSQLNANPYLIQLNLQNGNRITERVMVIH